MAKIKKKEVTFKNFKRRVWDMNPVERVVVSKKSFNKKKERQKKDWAYE